MIYSLGSMSLRQREPLGERSVSRFPLLPSPDYSVPQSADLQHEEKVLGL